MMFRWHPQQVQAAIKRGVRQGLKEVGILVANEMKRSMIDGRRIAGHKITRMKWVTKGKAVWSHAARDSEGKTFGGEMREVQLTERMQKKTRTTTKTSWIASPPGLPPGIRTGTLRNRSTYKVVAWNRIQVGGWAKYALGLEMGTRKMAARPFIRPALAKIGPRIQGIINASVQRELRALGGAA